MYSRAGAYVYNIIRGAHCILIVLYHDNGIAEIPKPFKRGYKAVVIALMKTYTRFVKNIKHTHK